MPINLKFQKQKLIREIRTNGTQVIFKRPVRNEFGEQTKERYAIGNVKALYHEQNSNVQVITGETTQTRTKKIPMLLFPYDEFEKLKLETGDIAYFNNKRFLVTGVVNVQEFNIFADVSLEVMDYGNRII